jgi:phosphoribosylformylglycinamidine cyclo-ligase
VQRQTPAATLRRRAWLRPFAAWPIGALPTFRLKSPLFNLAAANSCILAAFAAGSGCDAFYHSAALLGTLPQMTQESLSYRDAGVDIDAGDELVERIKPLAKKTMRDGVLAGIGGFGALFEVPKRYREPVLVSGTDGVGTKLRLAFELKRHDTVGIDLVAMSVNDILVQGAEPLFFLDYFACGKLDVATAAAVVGGIARGCEDAGCALIGGETAEMPGMYPEGEYDLAGFAVGVVEKAKIISGADIVAGDVVLGLPSSGAHSNGYSLVRKIIARTQPDLDAPFDTIDGTPRSLADAVMAPTRIYVKPLLALMAALPVKGMAHITGGGLTENVPRVLPDSVKAVIDSSAWQRPRLFDWLQREGNVADGEMHRVFNCGIGMVVVLAPENVADAQRILAAAGQPAAVIGSIAARADGEAATIVV